MANEKRSDLKEGKRRTENCPPEKNFALLKQTCWPRVYLSATKNPIRRRHSTLRLHKHTHILNSLLYFIAPLGSLVFFHSISHYSQALGLRDIDWQPQPEMSFRAVMFDRCWKNTDHWSGRLNELLLYIHTFISLYFLDHTHVTFFLDKHILHFCGFRVKSSKQRTVGGCA